MYGEGESIEVKNPDGQGWIRAKFGGVAVNQSKRVDHPGIDDGEGYMSDQAWVIYQEGERAGMTGLHPITQEIRPVDPA